MSHDFAIEADRVVKIYRLGQTAIRAVDEVSFTVRGSEYVSIMGPSGSGKTSLFNMIGGLDKPNQGTIHIDQVDITKLDAFELAWLRCRKIGYIFQTFNLFPTLSALENTALPTAFAGLSLKEGTKKARKMLESVGLAHRTEHKPGRLSGGEQQRVAIARALINDPSIVLADEPTGNLDLRTGQDIINLLKDLNRERGVTIITATHDLKMIDVSDRIFYMRDGKLEREETMGSIVI